MDIALFFAQSDRYEPWTLPPSWDAGRSGATILARDRYSGQIVVIKFTDNRVPVYDKRRQELENEVRALQALQGHGVPQLLDYGEIREESLRYEAYYLTVKG